MISLGLIKLASLVTAVHVSIAQASQLVNNQNLVLEIPLINLKKELYPNDKEKNDVNKNIEVIKGSVMPNKKGNLILASHSGPSNISYFKNLDKLKINDIAYVYYNNSKYRYTIQKIYDVFKTGYINIKRDKNKQTLTLITCKKNTNMQTVYIGYLNA